MGGVAGAARWEATGDARKWGKRAQDQAAERRLDALDGKYGLSYWMRQFAPGEKWDRVNWKWQEKAPQAGKANDRLPKLYARLAHLRKWRFNYLAYCTMT